MLESNIQNVLTKLFRYCDSVVAMIIGILKTILTQFHFRSIIISNQGCEGYFGNVL